MACFPVKLLKQPTSCSLLVPYLRDSMVKDYAKLKRPSVRLSFSFQLEQVRRLDDSDSLTHVNFLAWAISLWLYDAVFLLGSMHANV